MEVTQARLAATRGEVVFVDVRPEAQHALGHITGDRSVPIDQIPARQAGMPRSRRLVFYCSCPAEELALEAARMVIASGNTKVAVLVGGYDGWRASGGPVQVDATWEDMFRVSDPPVGWGKTPADSSRCEYARDDSVASRGLASGRITCKPDTAWRGNAGLSQKIEGRDLRGRQVTLSAMVRSRDVVHPGFLWIGAEDAEGHVLAVTRSDGVVGSQEWRRVEVSCVIPASASKVLVGISLTGSGRLWLDDVSLTAPDEPDFRAAIANSSFEN